MPGGNKDHTFLTKPATKRARFIYVCVTFC